MIQIYYAYIDPVVQDLLFSNVPPDHTNQWWKVDGDIDVNALYIDRHGELSIRPEPPTADAWWVWDLITYSWTDPRSAAEVEADLQRRRASTYLDKSDLLIRLAQFGILTPAEAEGAALGNIPTSMAAMLAGLPTDAQMAARIKWAADIQIGRTHPVIVAAAYALDLSDPLVDQIFGMSA